MWLLLAFIGVPLIEIGLFITVGGWIGLWPTLLIVVLTAIVGTILVRSQGLSVLRKIQSSFDQLDDPTEPIAHGAMILFSGALLLTPGFFTDAIGFALLVPKIREVVFRAVRKRVKVQSFQMGASSTVYRGAPGQGNVVDGEFTEVDPETVEPRPGTRPSGWTQG